MAGPRKASTKVTPRLSLSRVSLLCALALLSSSIACIPGLDFLASRDSDIKDSTQAIEKAREDIQRAKAYSSRGVAYSEKARFGRISKRVPEDECTRLFDLAIKDHNQAVALNPASAEVYFNRAKAYYDRGTYDFIYSKDPWVVSPSTKALLDAAASDFEKAIEKDPKNSQAFDMLGLTYQQNDQPDKAIQAYTQVMALDNHLGTMRLADEYCDIGFRHQQRKELPAAAAAYQKSTEFGVADDKSCPYDPFANSVAIYTDETHEYDKAWEVVRRALKMGHMISPELLLRLKRASGRTN